MEFALIEVKAAEVIAGAMMAVALGWCCRCKEFVHIGDSRLGGAAIEGEDSTGLSSLTCELMLAATLGGMPRPVVHFLVVFKNP